MIRYFCFLLVFSFLASSCKPHPSAIRIGDQIWMNENLSSDHFRNGDEIQQAKTAEEWLLLTKERKPAWCYPMDNADNGISYGKLYNWFAVADPRGIAPKGWHVPRDEEWTQLTDYYGGEVMAAYQLRTTGLSNDKQNETGFSGRAAGARRINGTFFDFGANAYWWTATESNKEIAWTRQLNYSRCVVNSLTVPKKAGLSVRCIKD
ncbi:MAG TPA: fibrobacter succinogenes major paralogous domain-containing protein [Bacteroidales bacterium]|jgi:uncharacterized protein (TIGR02145 family)|nr:fibrobacter succinogenes major paralogous domain-containing protein [Bacteroidales bacterium]